MRSDLTPWLTRVFAQDLDEPDCKLQNLVCSDLKTSLTHVFAQAVKPESLSREFQMPSAKCDISK